MKHTRLSLIFLSLVLALCGCGPAAPAEDSSSPSVTPSETPPSQAVPSPTPEEPDFKEYSFSDIEHMLRDAEDNQDRYVVEIRDAGDYTVVQYTWAIPGEGQQLESHFTWFDRAKGRFYNTDYAMLYVDHFAVTEDGNLLVMTKAIDRGTGRAIFPLLYRANFVECQEAAEKGDYLSFLHEEPYLMPLERGIQIGSPAPEALRSAKWVDDGCLLNFGPQPGEENLMIYTTPSEKMPEIDFRWEDGVVTLRITNTVLDKGFVPPEDPHFLSITEDNGDVVLLLDVGSATRYTVDRLLPAITTASLPWRPVKARIRFSDNSPAADYPEGW